MLSSITLIGILTFLGACGESSTLIDSYTRYIDDDVVFKDDVHVVNEGHLELINCDIIFNGFVNISTGGKFVCIGSQVIFNVSEGYSLIVAVNGNITIDDCNVTSEIQGKIQRIILNASVVRVSNTSFIDPNLEIRMEELMDSRIMNSTFESYSGIYVINCVNLTYSECKWLSPGKNYYSQGHGLTIVESNAVDISTCIFESMETIGLSLYGCTDVHVVDTVLITKNTMFIKTTGIRISKCDNITIADSEISQHSKVGITILESRDIIIWNNTFSSNSIGLNGYGGRTNSILENSFVKNKMGVTLKENNYWSIYKNNFYWNEVDAIDDTPNYWDVDQIGNYWERYNGEDTDQDGVGDSPFDIMNHSEDRYPLMFPWNYSDLMLLNSTPRDGQTGVSTNVNILFVFNFPIRVETFFNGLSIHPYTKLTFASQSVSDEKWYVIITLEEELQDNTDYTVTLTNFLKDIFNRSLPDSVSISFSTLDNTPPRFTSISPTNCSWLSPGTPIEVEVTDTNLKEVFVNYLDVSRIYSESTIVIETFTWPEIQVELRIKAFDCSNNEVELTLTYFVDGTLPVILDLEPPSGSVVRSDSLIFIKAADRSEVEISLIHDEMIWVGSSNPFRMALENMTEGKYNLVIRITDLANNTLNIPYHLSIDDTPPTISGLSIDDDSEIPGDYSITVLVDDEHIAEVSIRFQKNPWIELYQLNNTTFQYHFVIDEEMIVSVFILATDLAGNINHSSSSFIFDLLPPHINIIPEIFGTSIKEDTSIQVMVEDISLRNVSVFIDDDLYLRSKNRMFSFQLPRLDDENHSLRIIASDSMGRESTLSGEFIFDNVPPSIELLSPLWGLIFTSHMSLTIEIEDQSPCNTLISLDDEITYEGSENTISVPLKNESTRDLQIKIISIDIAGNLAEMIYQIHVDNNSPVIVATNFINGSRITNDYFLIISITDTHLDNISFRLNNGERFVQYDGRLTIPGTQLSTGKNVIEISAVDVVGNNASSSYVVFVKKGSTDEHSKIPVILWISLAVAAILIIMAFTYKRYVGGRKY